MNFVWKGRPIYYGWIITATLALTQTVSWGILYYSFSVFLTSFEHNLNASRATITGAFSIALLCSGVIALPIGRWIDRHGARAIMTVGSIFATLLFFVLAFVQNLLLFYLVWAGIGITMAMTLYEPAFAVVAVWFSRRRTSALALITFVAGLASTIFLPLANGLLQRYGLQTAILALAVLLGVVTIPLHAFILRRHPNDLGLQVDGNTQTSTAGAAKAYVEQSRNLQTALHDRSFWWMIVAFVLTTLSSIAITVHLIPYLLTRGFTPTSAAQTAGFIGAMQVVGRIIFTPIDGRISRYLLTAFLFVLQTIAILLLLLPNVTAVFLFVALFGTTAGAATLARPALIAEHYGPKFYGQISGVVATFIIGARALAPVGAGMIYVAFGSYIPVIILVAILSSIAVVVTLLIGNPTTIEPSTEHTSPIR